ncbi:hypothetical protein [Salinicoccus kekensis]|uniref:Uncharacterized protein n=1 Tax=Salinicoccus kekensis TaxID=714307 RepID=A0A285UNL9_9STAP|nr:hypothetical protein [Salinicoccus kekensis]SOC43422.1 hypothetical protein SAMN05878391_1975 [Salinicoccus kekensis]
MVITETLISVAVLAISAVFGGTVYMLMSTYDEKKMMLEELFSQFINLVIFIFAIKILMNLDIFISDPLAVLAYPSSSAAFYTAIVLTGAMIIYKNHKGTLDLKHFLEALIIVFLASSMVYEFIYFIIYDNTYAFGHFIMTAIVFIILYMLYGRIEKRRMLIITVFLWSAGLIILSVFCNTATVFDYTMYPWFIILLAAGFILSILYAYRKKEVGR